MENEKLSRQQLQNFLANWLSTYDGIYDKLESQPLYQQIIYKEKAKVILRNIEFCIDNKHDMQNHSQVIGTDIQNWFVAINVASNSLVSPDVAFMSGTLTKEEAQGKTLPDNKHSDLYLCLGKECINKIGAEKLLSYDDLSLESQYGILANLRRAVQLVASTENELSTKAEKTGYSLNDQIKGLDSELDKIIDLHNKE